MEEKSNKTGDFWSGLVLAGLGVYIVIEARRWDYLAPDGPGAGFFPLWYGVVMIFLSLALVFSSVKRASSSADTPIDWGRAGRALASWFALVVCVALLKLLGFVLSYALFTFFVVTVMYGRPIKSALVIALSSAAGFYLIFPTALSVQLPVGIFGF